MDPESKLITALTFVVVAGGAFALGWAAHPLPQPGAQAAGACLLDLRQLNETCDARVSRAVAEATATTKEEADVWQDQSSKLVQALSAEVARRDADTKAAIAAVSKTCDAAREAAERHRKITH